MWRFKNNAFFISNKFDKKSYFENIKVQSIKDSVNSNFRESRDKNRNLNYLDRHESFNEILEYINYVKPEKAYLTHLTALMDYQELIRICPKNVEPAFDNLEIII